MNKKYEKPLIAGLVALVVVVAWWVMSSPSDDQRFDGNGFDLRGAASVAARAAAVSAPELPRGPATNLTLISRTTAEIAPPPPPPQAEQAAAPAGGAAVADADGGAKVPAASPQEAAGWGVTLDGLKAGAFKFAWQITDHTRVLKYLLDNKTFNDAVFSTKFAQKICNDVGFAQQYMSDPAAKGGVQDEMWAVNQLLAKPASAKAAAESQFADRIMSCNSFQTIAHNKQAVTSIASANPGTLMVLSNPTALDLIGGNPKAQDALLAIQDGLNSGPPAAAPR